MANVKHIHEIRDPVHVFIRLDSDERNVLHSRPFQRLRQIHQLALTYLVYPGATHRRFEHSLGVMELAERVFNIITADENRDPRVRDVFPAQAQLDYWRRVLRMAALCHDIGHLPFSHAAEERLLPEGHSHETLTLHLIHSEPMRSIWDSVTPPLRPDDIAKLAVGPKKLPDRTFSNWEAILSEIIVGDSFGVDRMDYLLRDSLHTGVRAGRFDHYRLIDTLRVLPESDAEGAEPVLGIESGGLQSAEALLLARYFMYSQVYFHAVRRAYDIHLQDFMALAFGEHGLPTVLDVFLELTDSKIQVKMQTAAADASHPGHDPARRILCRTADRREHFRVLYERNPDDSRKNPKAAAAVWDAAVKEFGPEKLRYDTYRQKGSGTHFPVRARDSRIVSSLALSNVLPNVPLVAVDYVFVLPEILTDAQAWLRKNLDHILASTPTEEP